MEKRPGEPEKKSFRARSRAGGGLLSVLFSRTGLVILLLIAQAAITAASWVYFGALLNKVFFGARTLLILAVLVFLLNDRRAASLQLSWMLCIAAAPFPGALLYLRTRIDPGSRAVRRKLRDLRGRSRAQLLQNEDALAALRHADPASAALARYLLREGGFPVFSGCEVRYFPLGEEAFRAMLEQLRRAERFIFLEFFLIREGEMWDAILDVLERKAREGVEVRVLYDGSCEMGALPRSYPGRLRRRGVRAGVWLRLRPFITSAYNCRDHRKIMVIDGRVAFTGGVNLADEYINRISRFGHWKDSAVMLSGPAVRSFTALFLEMWNVGEKTPEDPAPYLASRVRAAGTPGWVVPFADSPLDASRLAKTVYEDILHTAERYVYIMTPYLVLDSETESALCFAAARGVDVRLLLPGIPDKPMVWYLAKRYYPALLRAGVRIWEYTPGFLHAKSFVSDDRRAVVGSVNLDCRSLYHHFECAVYLAEQPCAKEIKIDFLSALARSHEITPEDLRAVRLPFRLLGALLKLIAPLL